jgi:CheY-like chemotaxis protein
VDSTLPDLSGLALAETISQTPDIPETRIVLLCTNADAISEDAAKRAGIAARLGKPVRGTALYETLAGLLPPPPITEAPRAPGPAGAPVPQRVPFAAHILLAEDNPSTQRLMQISCERLGCMVDIVANGREAVEALSRRDYHMVFMDCQMPEIDGFKATRTIRASGDATIIVALTANAMKEDEERCRAAGMDDYLRKPFKQKDLLATLQKWLPAESPS